MIAFERYEIIFLNRATALSEINRMSSKNATPMEDDRKRSRRYGRLS